MTHKLLYVAAILLAVACTQPRYYVNNTYDEVRDTRHTNISMQIFSREREYIFPSHVLQCQFTRQRKEGWKGNIQLTGMLTSPEHAPLLEPVMYVVGDSMHLEVPIDLGQASMKEEYSSSSSTNTQIDTVRQATLSSTSVSTQTYRWLKQPFSAYLTPAQEALLANSEKPYIRLYLQGSPLTFYIEKAKFKYFSEF